MLSEKFICAKEEYCTITNHVNAPILRRNFLIIDLPERAEITVCGLGFYKIYINGREITVSQLAPYISNPNDIVYYQKYDIKRYIRIGKNSISFLLGNGMLNCIGGYIWKFDEADYRSAPKLAFSLEIDDKIIEADESVKVHDSAITFDDLRAGERYDARLELDGWYNADFDDSQWANAVATLPPKGEKRIGIHHSIAIVDEIKPIKIIKGDGGYIYDFGINTAGIVRLKINGKSGQTVKIIHSEIVNDGKADLSNISFEGFTIEDYNQCIIYTCKDGYQTYQPSFTFMGFRYAYVVGITEEQATEELLTMLVMHSDIKRVSDFHCSDETLNTLYKNAMNSLTANFQYFLMDCPQREKNGWTGDNYLSANQALLNYDCEKSLREWLYNVRKAQLPNGKLPGVIPTSGFGYKWGNGPAWDGALVELPFQSYRYTGDVEIIRENADAIFKYLKYMQSMLNEDGTASFGLGDWCQVGVNAVENFSTPLVITDTIICMDICFKSGIMFKAIKDYENARYCSDLYFKLKKSFRDNCITSDLFIRGRTQTGLAMALYYGIFEPHEKPLAVKNLVQLIKENNNHFDVGVLGARVLFRTLADNGYPDLALELIETPTFPSFAYHLKFGATSLFESFYEIDERFYPISGIHPDILSQNHHFWGDISAFFIEYFAGIKVNPYYDDCKHIVIQPVFVEKLDYAAAYRDMAFGRISVKWKKVGEGKIIIETDIPAQYTATLILPDGKKYKISGQQTNFTYYTQGGTENEIA